MFVTTQEEGRPVHEMCDGLPTSLPDLAGARGWGGQTEGGGKAEDGRPLRRG